jgi:hypothetical protein
MSFYYLLCILITAVIFRMACIYLLISALCLDVKLGCTKTSEFLHKRFQTYVGKDLLLYVWDIYYDNSIPGLGWKTIETNIHKHFANDRIWGDLEHFHLYDTNHREWSYKTRGDNKVNYYRLGITDWIMSHPSKFLPAAYEFGIRKRQQRFHFLKTNVTVEHVHGNLIFTCNCEHVYDFGANIKVKELVVDGKKHFHNEIGLVHPGSIMHLTQEFLDSFGNENAQSDIDGSGTTPPHHENCDPASFGTDLVHFTGSSGEMFTDRTHVVQFTSGSSRHSLSSFPTSKKPNMYGNNYTIERIARSCTSDTTPSMISRDRTPSIIIKGRVLDDEDMSVLKEKVGRFLIPKLDEHRDSSLSKLGFYDKDKIIKKPFDSRIDRETLTTVPSFTLLLSNYIALPPTCCQVEGRRAVSLYYRLWQKGNLGNDSVYEYKVAFLETSSSVVLRSVIKGESLVLVKGDPLRNYKLSNVEIISFKPREFVEAAAILEGLCKIFASQTNEVVLTISRPHSKETIGWDKLEHKIICNLNFKWNQSFKQYQYIIPVQSEWHDDKIVASVNIEREPFKGRSMEDLFAYEDKNGIKNELLPDDEVEALLKQAKKLTRRNQRTRRQYDNDQDGDDEGGSKGPVGAQSQSSQESSQESSAVLEVDVAVAVEDDRDDNASDSNDSFVTNDDDTMSDDDSEEDGEDDYKNDDQDDDQNDGSDPPANNSELENDDVNGWTEPPNETPLNKRNAMWITFYGIKGQFYKVGYYYVIE